MPGDSTPDPRPDSNRALAGLQGQRETRARAKLAIIVAWRRFHRAEALGVRESQRAFTAAFNAGEIALQGDLQGVVEKLSARSLRRWVALIAKGRPEALAGNYGQRLGACKSIDANPRLREIIEGMIAKYAHEGTAVQIHDVLTEEFPEADVPLLRTLQRWVAAWKREHRQLFTSFANNDAFRNKYLPAYGSASASTSRVNEEWQLDGTLADVDLLGGRHVVLALIDTHSRTTIFHVSRTSNAFGVAELLRKGIERLGKPERIRIDNGADFVSRLVGEACTSLNIEITTCLPGEPDRKPFVERVFGFFSHHLLPLISGYCGHDVAAAQAIRAQWKTRGRKEPHSAPLTREEFQKVCDDWTGGYYDQRAYRQLNGKSPFQVRSESRDPIQTVSKEALAILLMRRQTRVVGKEGIRLDGRFYTAVELPALTGERVLARSTPSNPGEICVFHREQFYCWATCPEVTGEDQRERALQARAWHKKFLAPERKRLKALRDDPTVANAAEIILAGGKRRADQVAAFPPKKVPFITTETEEADKAIAARPATAPDAQEAEDAREAEEQARVHKEWERISATLPRRVKSG